MATSSAYSNPYAYNPYGKLSGYGQQTQPQAQSSSLAQYAPPVPQVDYSGAVNYLKNGTTLSGQNVNQYQAPAAFTYQNTYKPYSFTAPQYQTSPYQQYQYSLPNISNIPQQAYGNVLSQGLGSIQQQMQQLQAQANSGVAARGFGGQSGVLDAANTSLGREALQQGSDLSANLGLAKAQAELQNAQFMNQQSLAMQQAQAGEGQFGANYNAAQQQFLAGLQQWMQQNQAASNQFGAQNSLATQQAQDQSNLNRATLGLNAQNVLGQQQLQQIGAYGTLANQATQQAMQPYQMLSQLYGQNIGIPMYGGGGSGKGDPFSALLGAGGSIAGSMFGGPAGGMAGNAIGSGVAATMGAI